MQKASPMSRSWGFLPSPADTTPSVSKGLRKSQSLLFPKKHSSFVHSLILNNQAKEIEMIPIY